MLRNINDLIDKGTTAKRVMVSLGTKKLHWGGYVAFVVNGKMYQRVVYFSTHNYILFRREVISIDVEALKPISGGFNVESLNS